MARPKVDNSPFSMHYRAVLAAQAMCDDWQDDPAAHKAALVLYLASLANMRDYINSLLEVSDAPTQSKTGK